MTESTVTTSFSGISDPTNWPPENGLAVGPAYVVTVESSKIEWTNLTGGAAFNESLYTLFGSLSASQRNSLLDARVAYDSVNGRFVVMAENLGSNESNIDIAVSKDSNPNDGWYVGSVSSLLTINGATTQADMPYLSVDGSKIYVSEAQYGSGFAGTQEWVFGDTAGTGGGIYNGGTLTTLASQVAPPSAGIARNVSNGQGLTYYVSVVPTSGQSVLTIQTYNSATNAFSAATTLALGNSDRGASSSDYTIAQEGTSLTLDAYDSRIASLAYSNGFLYGLSEVENVGTSIPEIHWFKLNVSNPGAPTIAAQGDITGAAIGAGAGVFNGSLAVDAAGDMIVNFTASSANMFPADYYMVMPSGSSSFGSPTLYQSSTSYYAQTAHASGAQRWGTYSTAIADPNDPNGFWISNEYVTSSGITIPSGLSAWWDTVTAQVHVSPATPPPAPTVTSITTSGAGITNGVGDLNAGKLVTLTVNFSEAVNVTGSPLLVLNDGGNASYTSASGTSALNFSYTVASNQNTSDLTVSSLNLNGGTIQDASSNNADVSGANNYNPPGNLQIDTTAPVVTITNTGGLTNQATQTLTGNVDMADAGSTVKVFDGATQVATTTVSSGGGWSANVTLASGSNSLTAQDTDAAGNTGTSSAVGFTLDTVPPTVSITNTGGVTNQASQTISGMVTAGEAAVGATVTLYDNGSATPLGTATVGAGGTWSTGVTLSGDGAHSIVAQDTDAAGNTGTSSAVGFTLDTVPPTVSITNTGGVTNQASQTISGMVTAGEAAVGATVTLYDNGSATPLGTATVGAGGTWSTGVTLSGNGAHSIVAQDTDAAGNTGTSSAVTFTLQTVTPTATIVVGSNDVNVSNPTATVTLSFSEAPTDFSLANTSAVGGVLSNLQQTDATHYTATFTAGAGVDISNGSVSINGNWHDAAGDTGSPASSPAFVVDTVSPTVAVSINSTDVNLAHNSATVTFTFSEAPTSFSLSDTSAVGGTLSGLAKVSATQYTATFMAAANTNISNGSVGVTAGSWQENNGNSGAGGSTGSFIVDTATPTVGVSIGSTDVNLAHNTATVSFTFSEAPTTFTLSDTNSVGGTLSGLVKVNATQYTATFTAAANTDIFNGSVSVTAGTWQGINGNTGAGGSSGNFIVDTKAPTVVSVTTSGTGITNGGGDLHTGAQVTLAVAMSEAVAVTGGVPKLLLNDGGAAVYSGVSGNSLLFNYTVQIGENTADLAVTGINVNGATIADATSGNPANLTGVATNPPGILQIDTTDHWQNSTSANWTTASDWTNGVPNTGYDVFIDAKRTYTVTVSNNDTAHSLTVNDSGATVADNVGGALTLAAGMNDSAGTFQLAGGSLTAASMTVGSSGQFVVAQGNYTGANAIAAPLTNNGSFTVQNSSTVDLTGAIGGSGSFTVQNTANLKIDGSDTGSGSFTINNGAALEFNAADSENVSFANKSTGTLKLDQSSTFTGSVAGLSTIDKLDLADLAFSQGHMSASFSGNLSGGVLSISDGSTTDKVALIGNYTKSTWNLSNDGGGGTLVVDPPASSGISAQQPSLVLLVQYAAAATNLGPPDHGAGQMVGSHVDSMLGVESFFTKPNAMG